MEVTADPADAEEPRAHVGADPDVRSKGRDRHQPRAVAADRGGRLARRQRAGRARTTSYLPMARWPARTGPDREGARDRGERGPPCWRAPPRRASRRDAASRSRERARASGAGPVAAAARRDCSLLLADFGADVLKVEETGTGDYIRWSAVRRGADDSGQVRAVPLAEPGQAVDSGLILQEHAAAEVSALVRESDVLLESFRRE